ncbi:hypothetical protein [Novosphingobium sp.]|uniref:hypothetical protein n=1 Tax=Novosphingobium sp. TaxID=1874826 RepID=UPI0031E0941E
MAFADGRTIFPSRPGFFLGDHPCAALLRSMARDDAIAMAWGIEGSRPEGCWILYREWARSGGMILTLRGAIAMILQASLVQDRDA